MGNRGMASGLWCLGWWWGRVGKLLIMMATYIVERLTTAYLATTEVEWITWYTQVTLRYITACVYLTFLEVLVYCSLVLYPSTLLTHNKRSFERSSRDRGQCEGSVQTPRTPSSVYLAS